MEIEELDIIPFDQLGKEAKEEKPKEEEKKETKASDEGLIPFDRLTKTEEKEEDKEEKEQKQPEADTTSKEYLSKNLKALYDSFGFEFKEEEFDGTLKQSLQYQENLANTIAQKKLEDYINALEPLNQKYLQLLDSGVPQEDADNLVASLKAITAVSKDDISTDVALAEKVQREYLKQTTSFSLEKIEKEIKKSRDAGTLIDEAESNYDELKQHLNTYEEELTEQAKEQEKLQKENLKRQAEELKQFINDTEEIAGIKLTKKVKDAWAKEYQTIDYKGQKVNPIFATRDKDPNKFDALMRFYHTIGLFNYNPRKKDFVPDLSVLKNVGKTDVFKELESALKASNEKNINKTMATANTADMEEVVADGFSKLKKKIEQGKIK